jgi:hypothetical protein
VTRLEELPEGFFMRGNVTVGTQKRNAITARLGGIARCLKNSDDGTAEVLRGGAGSGKWVRVFVLIPVFGPNWDPLSQSSGSLMRALHPRISAAGAKARRPCRLRCLEQLLFGRQ